MFQIGDKILHPLHGVGLIESVTEQEILGNTKSYFVVSLTLKKMKIIFPVDKAEEIGIRKITNSEQIEDVFDLLKSRKITKMPTNWNRRFKFNLDKIKTGDIKEVAEVLRNLSLKEQHKGLSMGEKKMLDNVKVILAGEISVSKNVDHEQALRYIDEALH